MSGTITTGSAGFGRPISNPVGGAQSEAFSAWGPVALRVGAAPAATGAGPQRPTTRATSMSGRMRPARSRMRGEANMARRGRQRSSGPLAPRSTSRQVGQVYQSSTLALPLSSSAVLDFDRVLGLAYEALMRASVVSSAGMLVLLVVMAAVCGTGDALAPSHTEGPEACCGIVHCSIATLTVARDDVRLPSAVLQGGAIVVPASTGRPPVAPPPEPAVVTVASLVG